jgi:hypothetical protein
MRKKNTIKLMVVFTPGKSPSCPRALLTYTMMILDTYLKRIDVDDGGNLVSSKYQGLGFNFYIVCDFLCQCTSSGAQYVAPAKIKLDE